MNCFTKADLSVADEVTVERAAMISAMMHGDLMGSISTLKTVRGM